MAERSEAKSVKRRFASKMKSLKYFDAKLRFALLASLRSATCDTKQILQLIHMKFLKKLVAHIAAAATELEPRSTIRRSLSFALSSSSLLSHESGLHKRRFYGSRSVFTDSSQIFPTNQPNWQG